MEALSILNTIDTQYHDVLRHMSLGSPEDSRNK